MAYPKSGTQDPGLLVGPKNLDQGHISWMRPGTLNMGPDTRDPKGETRDLIPLLYMGPKTRDTGHSRWNMGPL